MILGPIPDVKPGGERAGRGAQSMYGSYHDTVRTQILNLSQICEVEMTGFWW